ncbi:MAG: glycosyltransferase family 2 protein [Candidatus Rokuibacteriota bacterium]
MTTIGRVPVPPASELPLVSIVTPSLNQGRFIADAIESIRAQDYPRIEHIVMDGGSRDETPAVVARYADGLTWISKPDNGQSHAINRGFRLASGEILSWLNADDRLLPGAVRAVVDAFRADSRAMLVYGDGDLIDVSGRKLWPFRFTEPFNLRRLIEVGDFILQPAAFVRRGALEAVAYLDEDLHWCMDWDLWIRIGQRFPVRYLPVPLAQARIHPDTKTSRGGLVKIREMHRIIRRHSRRWLPPILVIHGGGALYRLGCRVLGRVPDRPMSEPDASRPLSSIPWAARLLDRVLETGRLPWERTPDPELRRLTAGGEQIRGAALLRQPDDGPPA